jgi:hypothetical protein
MLMVSVARAGSKVVRKPATVEISIVPGHNQIRDFSRSFPAVYGPDSGRLSLALASVRGQELPDGFRRGERMGGGPDNRLG